METEEIERLFSMDEFEEGGIDRSWTGDNAVQGILIIAKYVDYMKEDIICGASHDEFYSVDLETLVKNEITDTDIRELVRLNWTCYEGCLKCFV